MKRDKLTLGWRGETAPVPDITFVEEAAPAARAVPVVKAAAALRVGPWTKPDPLDYCLSVWKDWMATTGQRNLGTQIMRGLVGEMDGHG